ncbi:ARM repeat-containing protein [Tilletiaria anomala UBC 951]|uniref:ARM repeat-containing protein n=1 Tax=Tilletiaria anomala (strain ATCC 24038 / CBS 436.72 / UBC 951) TaxID=1037660 RepID=A0A066VWT1_TILAU|nr:ARM repeat-containing protein [Tilletiaria anomala UBC 951]KDN45921.1 ARM repeat-containing protein [Tilletiaria anomala UBC 951]
MAATPTGGVSQADLEHTLIATLSASRAEREAAESHLTSNLHSDPTCFIALVQLLLSPSTRLEARQAAAISLRPLVLSKWSPLNEKFDGYPPSAAALPLEIKGAVRQGLLQALVCDQRKIRLAASAALSAVASTDFPDEFTELLPFVRQCLSQDGSAGSARSDAVHGVMVFLSDFVKAELDENQLMSVAKEILPSLEAILVDEQNHTPHVRARALLLFRQLLEVLYMVREQYPEAAKQGVDSLLPSWLNALQALLMPSEAEIFSLRGKGVPEDEFERAWEGLAIRYEALKTLSLASHFKSHFRPHLAAVLQLTLRTLHAFLPVLQVFHISNVASQPSAFPPEGDASIASSLPAVCSAAVDLISSLLQLSGSASARGLMLRTDQPGAPSLLAQLAHALLSMAQMTSDEQEEWSADVNAFIAEQEDVDAGAGAVLELGGSLRAVATDAFAELLDLIPAESVAAFQRAFDECVQSSAAQLAALQRGEAKGDWWKPLEAALAVFGGNAPLITDLLEGQSSSSSAAAAVRRTFDIESIFQHAVIPYVAPETPSAFLRGQAFIFASQFSSLLPPQFARQFLEEAVTALEADAYDGEDLVVCVCAVRTVKNLHRHLNAHITQGFAQRILGKIGPMFNVLQGDAIVLLLETVQAVVVKGASDEAAAGSNEIPDSVYGEIANVSLAFFLKQPNDIVLTDVIQDLLEALSGRVSTSVGTIVVRASLPQLVGTLDATSSVAQASVAAGFDALALAASGAQTIVAVLRGANATALRETDAASTLLPGLTASLTASDDRQLLQSAVTALTLLLSKTPAQVLSWHHATGRSAMQIFLVVIGKLLDPSDEGESGGLVLGGLLLSLLRKGGDLLGPHLPELVQAMVARLASAQTTSLSQSLILPIAHLITESCATVIQLLESTCVSTSEGERSGLEVFLTRWAEESNTIQGAWAEKANIVALSELVKSGHPILQQLTVRGDIIPDDSGRIVTRSRAKQRPDKYTQVVIGSKIIKLLLEAWSHAGNDAYGAGAANAADADDDDEWDDEDVREKGGGIELSDMLGFNLEDFDDTDDFVTGLTPEELKADPINNIDLKSFIPDFLRSQASSQQASIFASGLDEASRELLQKALSRG